MHSHVAHATKMHAFLLITFIALIILESYQRQTDSFSFYGWLEM